MEERRYKTGNQAGRGQMRTWKKVLLSILAVLLALILGCCVFWKVAPDSVKDSILKELSTWPIVRKLIVYEIGDDLKEVQDTEFSEENITVNEEVYEKLDLTGYTNIALFGIDERQEEFDSGSRTDSIIIMSINNDTNAIRLLSVYRDTYLRQNNADGESVYNKANAAYATGGVSNAINMLNTNLDLNITDYAVINFSGLAKAIDQMGGITIKVNAKEQYYINFYLKNLRKVTGLKSPNLKTHGKRTKLTGLQAVAFCRIRYTTFTDSKGVEYSDDLGRTARQRYVIQKVVHKAKKLPLGKLMKLAKNILNMNTADTTYFKTSLSTDEILNLIPTMIDYNITGTKGFPFTLDYGNLSCGSTVVPTGLSYNVQMAHLFLFDEQNYEVSSNVQEISEDIIYSTGFDQSMLKTEDEEKLSPSYVEPETESESQSATASKASNQ